MAAALTEDLIEEVLLRIPPDDPASLVRAALVSKQWCRLICGRGFRRRFRTFHCMPPLLGLICQRDRAPFNRFFVPVSSFRPHDHTDSSNMEAIHSSHGRVLLHSAYWSSGKMSQDLFVWDPIVDNLRKLPRWPLYSHSFCTDCNAAVLCAGMVADGCNSLDCHHGPFIVVVGRAVYFKCSLRSAAGFAILKYDLLTKKASPIHILPDAAIQNHLNQQGVLMAMDGRLGFAFTLFTFEGPKLCLCSRQRRPDKNTRWELRVVIDLDKLLQTKLRCLPHVVAFADNGAGGGVIFIWSSDRLFSIDIKSGRSKVVGESFGICRVVPYISFCTPALGAVSIEEEPGARSQCQMHQRSPIFEVRKVFSEPRR